MKFNILEKYYKIKNLVMKYNKKTIFVANKEKLKFKSFY